MSIQQVPLLPVIVSDPGIIHVHVCPLELATDHTFNPSAILSLEEQQKIARYRDNRLQERMTVAHWWVRIILGRCLDMNPAAIQFNSTDYGKPVLAGNESQSLSFNLSHSENVMLLAVTEGQSVGIDLEAVRVIKNTTSLANRFFAPDEQTVLKQLQENEQTYNFYRTWTRKEACLKAWGVGLKGGLNRFSTLSEWATPPKEDKKRSPLHITNLPVDKPFVAALACPVPPTDVFIGKAVY
jgi:4'-phosphopantetheinyl transferase